MAFYDISTGRLLCSNAGHNPAILIEPNIVTNELVLKHGMALGVRPKVCYEKTEKWLVPGQILFLYTDGVTEALSPRKELFGTERLIRELSTDHGVSMAQLLNSIDKALEEFQQGNQFDDITMLALKRIS